MSDIAHIVYEFHDFSKIKLNREDLIITTCEMVYNKSIKERYNARYINLNTYRTNTESIKLFMSKLTGMLNKIKFNDIDLVLPNINTLFRNWYFVIDFMLQQIKKITNENDVKTVYLYGGHPKVPYMTLTLAEGERPKEFLYRRKWFYNIFINSELLNSSIDVKWFKKNISLHIKIIQLIRVKIIFYVKYLTQLFSVSMPKKNGKNENREKVDVILLVRNPLQVEPLVGIYNEMKKQYRNPVFAYSNSYLKRGVQNELIARKLPNYNLDSLIKINDIVEAKSIIKRIIKESSKNNISVFGVEYQEKNILRDLSSYMFDEILRVKTLDKFNVKIKTTERLVLIHNETYNYRAAIDSLWAKKNNYPIFSIQHVAMEPSLKPVMIWQDRMYMMTSKISKELNKLANTNKFEFLGPGSYDDVYNSSLATKNLKEIAIFTQTDGLSDDYIEIINDLIEIREKFELNFNIKVKLHPRETNSEKYIKKYSEFEFLKIASHTENTNKIVQRSDLAISIFSGVIFQSIIIGTPVIAVNYNQKHKYNTDYIEDEVTQKVHSKDDFAVKIINFENLRSNFLLHRKWFLSKNLCNYNGDSNKKISEAILLTRKE